MYRARSTRAVDCSTACGLPPRLLPYLGVSHSEDQRYSSLQRTKSAGDMNGIADLVSVCCDNNSYNSIILSINSTIVIDPPSANFNSEQRGTVVVVS